MVAIDNLDVLRAWLIRKLTPMCDADPAALAKYVVALVKKDKSEEDLRSLCNSQLEVFLQNETTGFVDSLFETLSSKSYLDNHPDSTTSNSSNLLVSQAIKVEEVKKEARKRIQRPSPIRHRSRSPYDRRRRREDIRFRRARSPNYERRDRRYRSRSPSPRKRLSPRKRSPVRRSRSRSPYARRSPRRRRTRSLSSSRSSSDPLSRSPDSTHPKPVPTSTDESKKKTRCWDYDQKGLCLLGESCPYDHGSDPVVVDESAISSSARPSTTSAAVPPPSIPPPPIVHPPPTRITPSHPPPMIPRFLPPPMIGFPLLPPGLRPQAPPIPPPVPPPIQNIRIPPPVHHPPPGYNPEAPGLNYKQRRQNLTNLVPISADRFRLPSEFTTGRKRIGDIENGGDENGPPVIKRTIYTSNSSAPQTILQNNSNYSINTKLIIQKIPPLLNNITKLNEHFAKFGAINNIQVRYDNDPGSALIEYAHVDSARSARMDTAAVLDNRFITVNWYNPSNSNSASAQQKRIPVKERLGILPTPSQLKYTAPGANVPAWKETLATSSTIYRTIANPIAQGQTAPVAKVQTVPPPQSQENEETKAKVQMAKQATKEKLLAHQKIVMQKNVEIQKQKQDLLQKQIQQQKLLLNKVESNKTMPTNERLDLLKTLRDVTASIDKLRTSLKSGSTVNTTAMKEKKKRTQKELLDAELDLYNASSTGENTVILKRKLNQLKVEASSLGLVSTYRGGWGAGRGRGRGRGSHMTYVARQNQPRVFSSSANLDRRPRELRITGFHDDEKDELISHLSRFGEIQTFTFSDDNITCTVKFQTRLQAETAALQAPSFKNRQLVIVWNCLPTAPARLDPPPVPASVLDSAGEDSPAGETEQPLIVGEDGNKDGENEDDDEDDAVVVHIGDVIAEHPDSVMPEEEEEEYGEEEEEELDEDALLAADFDEDDDHTADDDYEEEIRSWRH